MLHIGPISFQILNLICLTHCELMIWIALFILLIFVVYSLNGLRVVFRNVFAVRPWRGPLIYAEFRTMAAEIAYLPVLDNDMILFPSE